MHLLSLCVINYYQMLTNTLGRLTFFSLLWPWFFDLFCTFLNFDHFTTLLHNSTLRVDNYFHVHAASCGCVYEYFQVDSRDYMAQSPYFMKKMTYVFLEVDQLVDGSTRLVQYKHQACSVQMIQSLLWSIYIPFPLPLP